jgi:hypothetical protein
VAPKVLQFPLIVQVVIEVRITNLFHAQEQDPTDATEVDEEKQIPNEQENSR